MSILDLCLNHENAIFNFQVYVAVIGTLITLPVNMLLAHIFRSVKFQPVLVDEEDEDLGILMIFSGLPAKSFLIYSMINIVAVND